MKRFYLATVPLILPLAFWLSMLWLFKFSSESVDAMPSIAINGLDDVWFFYFPLLIFTMVTIFFVTRKRPKPSWKHFAIARHSIKRDVLIAVAYLFVVQSLLGSTLNVGLHFPGPEVYSAKTHGKLDVFLWVALQALFFVIFPCLWLHSQGFSWRRLFREIQFKRDIWIIVFFWAAEFFSTIFLTDFLHVAPTDYWYAIPMGILVNTLGAGLPVLIMIHLIILPRLSVLLNNQLLTIFLGGFVYALFSLFDPGVSYLNASVGIASISYIFATQILIGMGKASFTIRMGNPFVHFTSYHILGARVAFDTGMYAEIFK